MRHIVRIVALLMAALMVVTSCQAPDSSNQLTDGTVDVSFVGPSARTITTDDGLVQTVATSDLWFQYKAEWQGEAPVPSTAKPEWTSLPGPGLSSTVKLHRGRWNLSLRAFVNQSDVNSDDKFILSGTREGVEIGTNNMVTQTVSISLGYVRQEGDGTLHVSATYPVVYREGANPESPVEAVRKVKVTANVAGTDYTGDITAFDSNNVGTLDLTVPAGAAHVTVQYYMDDSTLFEDDQTAKDVLIMATMTTNLAVSVDRDITSVTFKAEQPEGTVEDNVIPKVFNSLFDIYPGPIADNEIVVGYAEETKALGAQTPITYPYTIYASATPDGQGRYKASDLGLVPITVTTRDDLNASSATEAWWGKTAALGTSTTTNTTLASVRFVDGVSYIRDYAFVNCSGLTSVTIPHGVKYIGNSAFEGCIGLTNITIPDSVTSIYGSAFKNCSGLTNITIPDGVTYIGPQAFEGCTDLTSVTIPDGITTIGSYLFRYCNNLPSVTIPEGVTSIGEQAFYDCAGLTSVTIPDSVTEIGVCAFEGCTSLTNITIPDGVTSIGGSAFSGCTNLTNVRIPDGVTEIRSGLFYDCAGLTSITIPEGVTAIGSKAFEDCTRLTSVTIPNSVTSIGDWAFKGCDGLTSVTIPSNVTAIEEYAFAYCTGLTSITISDGVTSIGSKAFRSCFGLTSITIPSSVTSIESEAFRECSRLTSVTILSNVASLGSNAFSDCINLTAIYINQPESDTLRANASIPEGCMIYWNSTGPEATGSV